MEDRAKTHGVVYDDGLIATDQPNLPEAIGVIPQQQYYHQPQNEDQHQQQDYQPQNAEHPPKQYYLAPTPEAAPFSDKTYYQPPSEYPPTQDPDVTGQRSILKRKSTWIVVALVVVVVVLAGVLGGVLTAKAKTTPAESQNGGSGDSRTPITTSSSISTSSTIPTPNPRTSSSTSTTSSTSSTTAPAKSNPPVATTTLTLPDGTVITRECPSADELDYYYVNNEGKALTFKRYCDTNFPNGDIGLANNKTIRSMPQCIEECGDTDFCVGAIWNNNGQCWLKNSIGPRETELVFGTESAVLQE